MPERSAVLKAIGLLLGLALFGWIIADAFRRSATVDWPPLPAPEITLAFLLAGLGHLGHSVAWTIGARRLAPGMGWVAGISVYGVSFLGRYLPGKIWQIGALSYFSRAYRGAPVRIAGYSIAFLVAYLAIGAIVFGVSFVALDRTWAWVAVLIGAPPAACLLAFGYGKVSVQLFSRLPVRWRTRLDGVLGQPVSAVASFLTLLSLKWILLVTACYVLVLGFSPDFPGSWSSVAVATTGGILAGFVVLIVPAGAGVREATIAVALQASGADPLLAIAVTVALRLIMTACELLLSAAGFLYLQRIKSNDHEKLEDGPQSYR